MRVMAAERLEAELAMHEDDRVAGLEEVLGGGGAARAGAEVVQEADAGERQGRAEGERTVRARRHALGAHTFSSSGTVVPPLCTASADRECYEDGRGLTVMRTTLRPFLRWFAIKARTPSMSACNDGGAGWVSK